MNLRILLSVAVAAFLSPGFASAQVPAGAKGAVELAKGAAFSSKDTLECGPEAKPDAAACLAGLRWPQQSFEVRCEESKKGNGDWLIRYPSPAPTGDATNDLVAMEWYMARDAKGQPVKAPAVVVIHESGRSMICGRSIARGLRKSGIHAFMIQLPGYGERTSEFTRDMSKMLPALKQAVADVRRGRDAVSVLPFVDSSMIALQGTSLGGFVAATVTGLDRGFDKSFILLAGGEIAEVLLTGKQDAARMRQRFTDSGVSDDQIREATKAIEPNRLAHRIDPGRTWLFTGKYDDVVPHSCSEAFAKAANLRLEHHYILPVGHYSAVLMMPAILPRMSEIILGR